MDAKPDRRSQLGRSLFWLGTRIADIGLWAGAAALLAVVVLNAVNIVLRYFFKMPLSWAEEAMLYLMIFGVYIGAVSVAWQQAHIRIDAVLDFAPPARRKVLEIVSTLVAEDYSPERTKRLIQPEALDYFIDRVGTLNPNLKSKELFRKIDETLKAVRAVVVKQDNAPLTLDEVKKIRDLTKATNGEIADMSAKQDD